MGVRQGGQWTQALSRCYSKSQGRCGQDVDPGNDVCVWKCHDSMRYAIKKIFPHQLTWSDCWFKIEGSDTHQLKPKRKYIHLHSQPTVQAKGGGNKKQDSNTIRLGFLLCVLVLFSRTIDPLSMWIEIWLVATSRLIH